MPNDLSCNQIAAPLDSTELRDCMVGAPPLPPGAEWGRWLPDEPPRPHQVVYGAETSVAAGKVSTQAIGVQYPDGSVNATDDPPCVYVSVGCWEGAALVAGEARELAAVLLAAADQIDGWVAR